MTAPRQTPNPATTVRPERSSRRVARKKPLAWLPFALLAALALLIGLIFLAINAVDDDGPDGPAGDSLGQAGVSDGSGVNGQDGNGAAGVLPPVTLPSGGAVASTAPGSSLPSPATSVASAVPGAGAADLKVADADLLGLSGSSLADRSGQPVTGTAKVQSVVSDEGFWVGNSAVQRVFVYLTPAARKANGESGFQVKQGQSIQLTGQMATSASSPKSIAGVTDAEGKSQLESQGAFVNATAVALSS